MKNIFIISTLLILGSSFLLSEEGCIQGDCENGYGTKQSNGNTYVGEWRDSYPHGHGTMTFSNGEEYVGGLFYSLFDGYGTYTSSDGTILFQGQWEYDSPVE